MGGAVIGGCSKGSECLQHLMTIPNNSLILQRLVPEPPLSSIPPHIFPSFLPTLITLTTSPISLPFPSLIPRCGLTTVSMNSLNLALPRFLYRQPKNHFALRADSSRHLALWALQLHNSIGRNRITSTAFPPRFALCDHFHSADVFTRVTLTKYSEIKVSFNKFAKNNPNSFRVAEAIYKLRNFGAFP